MSDDDDDDDESDDDERDDERKSEDVNDDFRFCAHHTPGTLGTTTCSPSHKNGRKGEGGHFFVATR